VTPENSIIRDVYACALDDKPWQDVVTRTATLLDASGAFLFTTFLPESDGGLFVSHGVPEREAKKYLTEVATVDVWYHELLKRHGSLNTGVLWKSDDLLPEKALRRTRFFADYCVPTDIGRNLGTMVGDGLSSRSPMTPLCVYRPIRSKAFSAADSSRLAALQPHFTQALTMRQELRLARQGTAALALERVSTAVVVLAKDRKILLANPAAERIFETCGMALVKDGRLCASTSRQSSALDKALQACCAYRFENAFTPSVRLGGQPGHGVVLRLAPPPASTPLESRAGAVAFLSCEGATALDIRSLMRVLYALSPAEAELVKGLAEGLSPESFAERRGVGLATVRTQLRAAFSKTGTRRQSELMRLVYSIAR
jgi:DNA-binding CsgD family transcriptional regulator/PAS domain-containing protein